MFEAEIESTKLRLAEQLLTATSGGLHLVQVLDHPTLDHAYKQFFRAEIEWMLYQERILRQANLPIEPHDPVFRRVYGQFEEYVRTHAWFDRKTAVGLIDSAVKSILNYRLRPRVTLKWFVFRGEPTKPVCEILLRMRYFADYPYFQAGFEQWMQDRSLDEHSTHIMPIFEFERLVKQLDDDYILDLSTTEFIELLDPIFRFFNDAHTPIAVQTIPIEALIVFLDDKDIQVIAQKLERMLYHDGVRSITREMILRVVDQVLQELEQQGQSSMPTEEESAPPNAMPERSDLETDRAGDEDNASQALPLKIEQPTISLPSAEHPEPFDKLSQEQVSAEAVESWQNTECAQQDIPTMGEHARDNPTAAVMDTTEHTTSVEQLSNASVQLSVEEESPSDAVSVADDVLLSSAAANAPSHQLSNQETAAEPSLQVENSSERQTFPHQTQPEDDEHAITIETIEEMVQALETLSDHFLVTNSADSIALEREFELPQHEALAPDKSATSAQEETEETAADSPPPSVDTSSEVLTLPYDEVLETGLQQVRVRGELRQQSYASLTSLLDERLKEAVLNKLCSQDHSRYQALLMRLDAAPSIRSALNELDRYCAEFGLDPKSKVAQELRMVLVKRYTLA